MEYAMLGYRLHLLDQNMKIFELREVACDTDADAMSNAYGVLAKCHAVEVWIGTRMVARVPRPVLTVPQNLHVKPIFAVAHFPPHRLRSSPAAAISRTFAEGDAE